MPQQSLFKWTEEKLHRLVSSARLEVLCFMRILFPPQTVIHSHCCCWRQQSNLLTIKSFEMNLKFKCQRIKYRLRCTLRQQFKTSHPHFDSRQQFCIHSYSFIRFAISPFWFGWEKWHYVVWWHNEPYFYLINCVMCETLQIYSIFGMCEQMQCEDGIREWIERASVDESERSETVESGFEFRNAFY